MVQNKKDRIRLPPQTVFIKLKKSKDSSKQRYENGDKLFLQFRRINAISFQNQRQLLTSLEGLDFRGYIRPYTLVISGAKQHVDNIKSAWNRNTLQAPDGFQISYFGELSAFKVDPVSANSSASFSLSETLYNIILQLKRVEAPTNVLSIQDKLTLYCEQNIIPRPHYVEVFETLNNLVREKVLGIADTGYYLTSREYQFECFRSKFSNEGENRPASISSHNTNQQPKVEMRSSQLSPQKRKHMVMVEDNKNTLRDTHVRSKENNVITSGGSTLQRRRIKIRGKTRNLKKLFGLQAKTTKVIRTSSEGGTASSSGCSSISSLVDSNDEEISPPGSSNDLNDSLTVHCGERTPKNTIETVDSDYSDAEMDEADDVLTEMRFRSMKNQRCTATTHLLQRPIVNPVNSSGNSFMSSSIESSDTDYFPLPTPQMYFEKTKAQSLTAKLTRQSTKLSLSQDGVTVPLPNISSITMYDRTMAVSHNMTESAADTSVGSTTLTSETSRYVEGKSESLPSHSTPTDESETNNNSYRRTFNVTGHSDCTNHRVNCDPSSTPHRHSDVSRAESVRSKLSAFSIERFCDCESVLRCGCSSVASSVAYSKRNALDPAQLQFLGNL